MERVTVAVVQTASVMLDREATTARACDRIAQASARDARLVLFPEALIPGYPRGLSFGTVVGSRTNAGRDAFARYAAAAVDVPGPATHAIGEAAKQAQCWVAVGVVERASERSGTLYCSILYFAPDGTLVGRHRKLKPTAAERLIWGEGDGSTLPVFDTAFGRAGGLICWENLMPLARAAMYAKGIDLWLAPTADARDSWQATIRHIACEGRCFVLSCNQYVTRDMLPDEWADAEGPDTLCRGGSAIIGPLGDYLAGPLYDADGILAADLDLEDLRRARFDFDANGHYARPDVFTLLVNEEPAKSVRIAGASAAQPDAISGARREARPKRPGAPPV
jgi:nitrilase